VTLRLRLALLYGALSSLALAVALTLAYGFYERATYRNADGLLQVFAQLADGKTPNPGDRPYAFVPAVVPITLRAVNSQGQTVRSGGMEVNLPQVEPISSGGRPAHAGWVDWLPAVAVVPQDSSRFSLTRFEGQRWRIYNQPEPNGETLQVIIGLGSTDAAVARVRNNYIVFGSLGALAVGLLGYLISGQALRPVAALTDLAQTVASARDPQFRLPKTGPDELGRLGATFNAMLESLSAAARTRELALEREHAARLGAEGANAALARSQGRFQSVVESKVVGVMIAQPDATLSYANAALNAMLGYDDLVGQPYTVFSAPEYAVADERATQELIQTGSVAPFEKEYVRADGSRIPVLVSATLLEGTKDEVVAFVLDISERKRQEAALRDSLHKQQELVAAQHRFVNDAAHELRAPLTAIQGNLELLERYPQMPEDSRQEAVAEAARGARRLARLAQDMLTLARGDAGQELEFHPLSFDALVVEVVQAARHQAAQHDLNLEQPVPSARLTGHADRLRQLVTILVDNALKYTPSGGHVSVRLTCDDSYALLRVSDSGPGIAAQNLERVFDRFYRAQGGPGGAGLGLAIARKITEQHGGEVWLESKLGVGTQAFVRLPLERSAVQV
jgi:PAS domain S-box-containing protein